MPEEIAQLARKVKAAGEAGLTFTFFNNHWQAYAPRNAVDLQKSLQLSFRDFSVAREIVKDEKQRLLLKLKI